MQFDAHHAKALQPGQHMVVGGCPGLRRELSIYNLQPCSAKAAARDGEGLVLSVTNWTPP